MRIQDLTIIFIIIILPISMILTAYTKNQIKTLNYQISYDSKLDDATYDTLKAFQLNTFNNSTSDLANSKMRDIEAAANTFFDSISENFNMVGYNSDTLKDYVPAIVFTMYDGYYIYSLYNNTLDANTQAQLDSNVDASIKGNGEQSYGIKPYIYYSCRYIKGDLDVVITYALDNYIEVHGTKNGSPVNVCGYVINGIGGGASEGDDITYRGLTIKKDEDALYENLGEYGTPINNVKYFKENGVKYYEIPGTNNSFSLISGKKYVQTGKKVSDENTFAYNYFYEAKEMKTKLEDSYGITQLQVKDAVDEKGEPLEDLKDDNGNVIYKFKDNNSNIFEYYNSSSGISIEEPNSNFNQHRLAIIRYAIEKNLSIAIANYNSFGTDAVTANFQMPTLKEEEWEKILNNVSIIGFLQGLSIGGKVYNGYSIVTNNRTEEVVADDAIYITTSDNQYHRITDPKLITANNLERGYFNVDFERRTRVVTTPTNAQTSIYYYPQTQYACYDCLVSSISTNNSGIEYDGNIYKYMDNIHNSQPSSRLPILYYTALARERQSMYKANKIVQ